MISENLSDYLELWGVEENILVFNDGSLGVYSGLMGHPSVSKGPLRSGAT